MWSHAISVVYEAILPTEEPRREDIPALIEGLEKRLAQLKESHSKGEKILYDFESIDVMEEGA